jgi:hypothetical protein
LRQWCGASASVPISWISEPIFDGRGYPGHVRGVTAAEGLYFLGLPWQYTWGSGRFSGIDRDARYLFDHIAALRAQAGSRSVASRLMRSRACPPPSSPMPVDAASSAYGQLMLRSQQDPQAFWREQASRIHWQRDFDEVLDDSRAPFARWFAGGLTNPVTTPSTAICAERGEQAALVCVSQETGQERVLTYRQLHREVNVMAAILRERGVQRGDRVLVYLAGDGRGSHRDAGLRAHRRGAFGGLRRLRTGQPGHRLLDAAPALVVCADAGFQNGVAVSLQGLGR